MVAIEHSGRTFCAVITRPTTIPNPMRKGRIAALLPLLQKLHRAWRAAKLGAFCIITGWSLAVFHDDDQVFAQLDVGNRITVNQLVVASQGPLGTSR
jgi:hypothetical protein